jgi:hypothetical protein
VTQTEVFPDYDENNVPICNTGCPGCKHYSNRSYCTARGYKEAYRVEDGITLCYPALVETLNTIKGVIKKITFEGEE